MPLSRLLRPARLALATGLLALPLAALAEWRDIPYADVAKMPLMLQKVDPASPAAQHPANGDSAGSDSLSRAAPSAASVASAPTAVD